MSASASEDICPSLAAAATIVLDVRSTQVTSHVCPLLVAGSGPIKSIAQLGGEHVHLWSLIAQYVIGVKEEIAKNIIV